MEARKVIKYILCKLDGREYQVGESYQGSPERIQELVNLGYLENEQGGIIGNPDTAIIGDGEPETVKPLTKKSVRKK